MDQFGDFFDRAQRISANGPNKEKTAVEKREKELRAKLKDQNDSNKKNKMLSMKNEKSDSQNPAQNSPPKNGTGKLANHQQTGPKTKSKAGNTMKQRKLEEKANKETHHCENDFCSLYSQHKLIAKIEKKGLLGRMKSSIFDT